MPPSRDPQSTAVGVVARMLEELRRLDPTLNLGRGSIARELVEGMARSPRHTLGESVTQAQFLQAGVDEPLLNLAADHGVVETRLMASLGIPTEMLGLPRPPLRGRPVHMVMFDDAQRFPGASERRRSRAANFGLIYGIAPSRIEPNLNGDQLPQLLTRADWHRVRDDVARMRAQPYHMILGAQDWEAIRCYDTSGTTIVDHRQRALGEIMAAEDRLIFAALESAGRNAQASAYARMPDDPRMFQQEYMGNFASGLPEVPPTAVINPRALDALLVPREPSAGRVTVPPLRLGVTPDLHFSDIVAMRDRLNVQPGAASSHMGGGNGGLTTLVGGRGGSTNPCGEIELGPTSWGSSVGLSTRGYTAPRTPYPKQMNLEQMEKIAITIRLTAWQKLLKDDYPY